MSSNLKKACKYLKYKRQNNKNISEYQSDTYGTDIVIREENPIINLNR